MTGVSFVIPVHNGGAGLVHTVRAVFAQATAVDRLEVLLVDDGSTDGAIDLVHEQLPYASLRVLRTPALGAAAAINRGLTLARYALVAQVDQDVVLHDGWLARLLPVMTAADVAAVQGQYVTDRRASVFARVMGRDLETRYARLGVETGHVCTGNALYRASALMAVGGFDESFGYGYDNDMSYRLQAAGYRLRYCAQAHSTHRWREGPLGYARQQYGFGYGRLDLVARHRRRFHGDSVSPPAMMLHPAVLGLALLSAAVAMVLRAAVPAGTLDGVGASLGMVAAALVLLLLVERAIVGVRAAYRFHDWVPLLFPAVHLWRDLAWVAATVVWAARRAVGAAMTPSHSMAPRLPDRRLLPDVGPSQPTPHERHRGPKRPAR